MKLLLYCTKAKPYLYGMYSGFESRYGYHTTNDKNVFKEHSVLNGKIIAECDFEVDEIELLGDEIKIYYGIENEACLTTEQIENYLGYDNDYKGYAIHIKNLHIFDKPKELSDYESFAGYKKYYQINDFVKLEKAPQNMCKILKPYIRFNRDFKVYEDFDILISIRPEWLCKILNGEKTIEVKKKVLKEMLK